MKKRLRKCIVPYCHKKFNPEPLRFEGLRVCEQCSIILVATLEDVRRGVFPGYKLTKKAVDMLAQLTDEKFNK